MANTKTRSGLIEYVTDTYYDKRDPTSTRAIQRAVQNGLRTASDFFPWSWLKDVYQFGSLGPYGTTSSALLTCDVTSGSTTVTGNGTTFPSDIVGQFIRLNNEPDWKEITVRGSGTSLTMRFAWRSSGGTALDDDPFDILYPVYSLPANFRSVPHALSVIDTTTRKPLQEIDAPDNWWHQLDSNGVGTPTHYSIIPKRYDVDTYRLLLQPTPDAVRTYEIQYDRHAGWISAADPAAASWAMEASGDSVYVDWPVEKFYLLEASILMHLWGEVDPSKFNAALQKWTMMASTARANDSRSRQKRSLNDRDYHRHHRDITIVQNPA